MKCIYIAGLEHSGTTLASQILSANPKILCLGEISQFFSPEHMKNYIARWGACPSATLCSCAKTWSECEFWGSMNSLCGLNSRISLLSKYKRLFAYVREAKGDDAVIVDSSKTLATLKLLIDNRSKLFMKKNDLYVVFVLKDVRSFAKSIASKCRASRSLFDFYRLFNLWLGANKSMIEFLELNRIDYTVNLYEKLCFNPRGFLDRQFSKLGLPLRGCDPDISQSTSHFAMGNRSFLFGNRDRIMYDSRWFCDDQINLVYLLHLKARAFNKYVYALAD